MIFKKIFQLLVDSIYPRRCTFCDCVLGRKERYLCKTCRNKIPSPITEPRCKTCGKPLRCEEKEYCYDCDQRIQSYEAGIGIFLYQGIMKEAVMRFKFQGRKEYGMFLGKLMNLYAADFIKNIHPDMIVPVPIHRKKQSRRGYNQAEVLAQIVSKGFSIPIRTDLVLRKKFTKAQKELNRNERKKNIKKAFQVKKEAGKYKRILIIDDIYTTGTTINEMAQELKSSGVEEVYFLVLCIGQGM